MDEPGHVEDVKHVAVESKQVERELAVQGPVVCQSRDDVPDQPLAAVQLLPALGHRLQLIPQPDCNRLGHGKEEQAAVAPSGRKDEEVQQVDALFPGRACTCVSSAE